MTGRHRNSLQMRIPSNRRSLVRFIAAAIIILVMPLFIPSGVRAISVEAGQTAPDFTLTSLNNEPVTLSKHRGTIVVLLYINTEQERSLDALKDIQNIFSHYRKRGIEVLGVTAGPGDRESILHMARENGIEFPILLDSERNVYGSYGIRVYPSTVIIGADGKVVYGIPGHSLSYKVKMEGRFRYLLGDITADELETIMSPKREVKDESLLKAERLYNLAMNFTRSRMNDQAIMTVKQSIAAKPDSAKSHILLGFLLLEDGEADEAYDAFTRALDITPDSNDARTGLGSALIEKGELDRAIKILTDAASLNPHAERTLYELGRAYSLKGDSVKAAEMYKKALEKLTRKHILPSALSGCQ